MSIDKLLSPMTKGAKFPLEIGVPQLRDVILAVHDVLTFAQESNAEVMILCRSLDYRLREKLWADVSGSTFGEQLEEAIEAGARVRLLLTNDLRAEDQMISAKVVSLASQYPAEQFDMFATGKMAFFDTFPHFTVVKASQNRWYDYIEWRHILDAEPEALKLTDRVQGSLYLEGARATEVGRVLSDHFSGLFDKARKAAAKKGPSGFAAYSIA